MNIIKNIYEISAKKKILESYDMKTLTAVAHNLYIPKGKIPKGKINKEVLINKIIYRKYMELLLYLDNNCFGNIRKFLTYKDDINLMLTCKTLEKKIRRKNYWCDLYKVMNRINIKSNPNFIPKKINQINKLFDQNGHLEENDKIITIILENLLSKVNSLYKVKKKKQIFIVIINFTLERQQFLRTNLDFAKICYDKMVEYENDALLKDFIVEAKNKFLKLGISI